MAGRGTHLSHGGPVRTRTHVKIGEERSSARAYAHAYARYGLPGARHLYGIRVHSYAYAPFLCACSGRRCSKIPSGGQPFPYGGIRVCVSDRLRLPRTCTCLRACVCQRLRAHVSVITRTLGRRVQHFRKCEWVIAHLALRMCTRTLDDQMYVVFVYARAHTNVCTRVCMSEPNKHKPAH